jgi:hypothetical protein
VSRPRVWCAPRQRAEPQQRALTRLPRSVHSRRKEWEFHLVFCLFLEPTYATPLNVAVQQPWLLLQLPSMGWCVTPTPDAEGGADSHPRNTASGSPKSHPHHADTATLPGRKKSDHDRKRQARIGGSSHPGSGQGSARLKSKGRATNRHGP